jgi:hypothetical protein
MLIFKFIWNCIKEIWDGLGNHPIIIMIEEWEREIRGRT